MKIADGSSLYHVTDGETLNSLILQHAQSFQINTLLNHRPRLLSYLGDTTITVDTTDDLVVATSVLVTSIVSSLTSLHIERFVSRC